MSILDMSLGGGVLIAAILALRRGLLYRLPKWTFLLLWAVALCRLLIPFAVPSPISVHTGAAWAARLLAKEEAFEPVSEPEAPVLSAPVTSPGTFREDVPVVPALPAPAPAPVPETESASPLKIVRLTGTALCGLLLAAAYLRALYRFRDAVPAEADFVRRWQKDHPTLFPVQIKLCGEVSAPLAYGLLRPVVLLPEDTDWSDEHQLNYVLTHEYIHICRGDLLWKLLLAAALCVHWFNPLVWIMYIRANQDLELACDEAVVRTLGLDSRKDYAYALLAAAESGFSPLCITYATINHMEERIRAIMKIKKRSTAAILCAAVLVAGISAVFATSAKPAGPKDLEDLPSAVMADQTVTPAPTPLEKDVSKNTPERVHPITSTAPDTSAALQPTPDAPEQDMEPVQQPVEPVVEPVADTAEPQPPVQPEPAAPALENRWGVPDGEIPRWTEFTAENSEDAWELGRYLEEVHGLYPGDYDVMGSWTTDIMTVQVTYIEKLSIERPPFYPVNTKGETYGSSLDYRMAGYLPDLIAVRAKYGPDMVEVEEGNEVSGYLTYNDYMNHGYPGPTPQDSLENMDAFWEWYDAQTGPLELPVYDVEHETIVGYFEILKSSKAETDAMYGITPGMSLEEARERIANGPQK